jgi:hypothetical protein
MWYAQSVAKLKNYITFLLTVIYSTLSVKEEVKIISNRAVVKRNYEPIFDTDIINFHDNPN